MLTSASALRKDRAAAPPLMQHRHFAFIASVIAEMPSHAPSLRSARQSAAGAFAQALVGSNPNFDRVRFLRACGIEAE